MTSGNKAIKIIGMLPVLYIEIFMKPLFILLWLQIKASLTLIFIIRMSSFDSTLYILTAFRVIEFVEFAFF